MRKINMAQKIPANSEKSGSLLWTADDSLPALLPNLGIDTEKKNPECFLNKSSPA